MFAAFALSLCAGCVSTRGDGATSGDASPSLVVDSGADSGAAPSSDTSGGSTDGATEAGPGCPGVPIVPDDGGLVAQASNSVGIHGSWFVYSDCADLNGVNCAVVTSPLANAFPNSEGKMCTSGTTSTAPGAWGAGIALELNDGPPQLPYDTTASGITGFCFTLSGPTLPSTSVRVAFPTQDNNDNAYFQSVNTVGQHTVLFADTAQGSWVTPPAPFEPTKVTLIQFQIPSSTTVPIAWDFCVDGLTAVTP